MAAAIHTHTVVHRREGQTSDYDCSPCFGLIPMHASGDQVVFLLTPRTIFFLFLVLPLSPPSSSSCSSSHTTKGCWSVRTAGRWSCKSKSAEECVITHLPFWRGCLCDVGQQRSPAAERLILPLPAASVGKQEKISEARFSPPVFPRFSFLPPPFQLDRSSTHAIG